MNITRAKKTERIDEVLGFGKYARLLKMTNEELLSDDFPEDLKSLREIFCSNGTLLEADMAVGLTRKREDEILCNLGFNAGEIQHKEIADVRNSYDPQTFMLLKSYLENIRSNYVDGISATFLGKNGSGKTSSMALAFRYLVRAFYNPINQAVNLGMVKEPVDRLLEMILADNYNRRAWYCEVRVLGMDDILHYTDTRHNALRFLVNERTSKGPGYLTLMTSRLTKNDLENYSDVYSRMNYGLKFWTGGKDFRTINRMKVAA